MTYIVWKTMHLFSFCQINIKGNANKDEFPFNILTTPAAFLY